MRYVSSDRSFRSFLAAMRAVPGFEWRLAAVGVASTSLFLAEGLLPVLATVVVSGVLVVAVGYPLFRRMGRLPGQPFDWATASTRGEVSSRMANEERRRFVVVWHRVLLVGGFGSMAGIIALMAATSSNSAVVFSGLAVSAPVFAVALRSLRSAAIEFRDDEVLVYGFLRTKRVPLSRVREAGTTRGTSAALLPWRVPYLRLDDGTVVTADDIRSLRTPSIVDDVVAEVKRRLEPPL
jgi:hypothetical protein